MRIPIGSELIGLQDPVCRPWFYQFLEKNNQVSLRGTPRALIIRGQNGLLENGLPKRK